MKKRCFGSRKILWYSLSVNEMKYVCAPLNMGVVYRWVIIVPIPEQNDRGRDFR